MGDYSVDMVSCTSDNGENKKNRYTPTYQVFLYKSVV